jgi:hypothetical protein
MSTPDPNSYDGLKNVDFDNYKKLNENFGNPEDGKTNHPFFYPGANPPHINNRLGTQNSVFKNLPKMRRGFMRSILFGPTSATSGSKNPLTVIGTDATKTGGNVRLNFQFNPEYIERNVAQSQGAVNPLLQNPANLTQPVPGTASFNFTMTFNREYEVVHRDRNLRFDSPDRSSTWNVNGDFSSDSMLRELADPRYSGVLHDLSIFDKIVGQGISQDVIETIAMFNKKISEVQQASQAGNTNPNNAQYIQNTPFDVDVFKQTLTNKNFGNSAFINPLPVRIVFGDLFMVEGFVTGSAVAFQKFSQQMVPTICQVNCTVQALYFGFAKRKAFLTDSLEDWYKSTITPPSTTISTTANELLKDITYVGMLWNNSGQDFGNKSMTDDYYNLDMPDFNSDITKVLVPTNTWDGTNPKKLRYAGNDNTASKYLTLPQWFNTFSQTAPDGQSSSTVTRNVGGNKKRTMEDMLQEKVLGGQIANFNANWQRDTGLSSARLLQGYTPLVVGFRIFNPKVNPAGSRREKDFPNEDFSSIFQFELTRITVTPMSKTQLIVGEIEVLQIPYVDTTHWSSWYRQWRKNFKDSMRNRRNPITENVFDSPMHRSGVGGFSGKAPDSMTDFVKIYWVRPKFTENIFITDDSYKGVYTAYEIKYYFVITINNTFYNVTPLTQSCQNDSIFITNEGIGVATRGTRWTAPNFKVG